MSIYRLIGPYYDLLFPARQAQLDFFRRLFEDHGVETVLDLACGTGNYALAFTRQGLKVSAVDLDPEMVAQGRIRAAESGLAVDFRVGDMRDVGDMAGTGGEPFDAVICIGNSLVHLLQEEDVLATLRGISSILRPQGVLVIQIVNYDRVYAHRITGLPPLTHEETGVTLERLYDPLPGGLLRFTVRLRLPGGEDREAAATLRPVFRRELEGWLRQAQFDPIRFYGDFDFSPHHGGSPATIAVARSSRRVPGSTDRGPDCPPEGEGATP